MSEEFPRLSWLRGLSEVVAAGTTMAFQQFLLFASDI